MPPSRRPAFLRGLFLALVLPLALPALAPLGCHREGATPSPDTPDKPGDPTAPGKPGDPTAPGTQGRPDPAAPPPGHEETLGIPVSGPIVLPAKWTSCTTDAECVIVAVGCCSEAAAMRSRADEVRAAIGNSGRAICPVKTACGAGPSGNNDGQPALCRQQQCLLPGDLLSLSPGSGPPPSSPALAASTAPDDASLAATPPDPGPAAGKKQKRAAFQCFSWFHGRQASTDCYRTGRECAVERKRMEDGARPAAPCERVVGASCTMVSRPEAGFGLRERCFALSHQCEAYRAFVQGNHLTVTPCVDR